MLARAMPQWNRAVMPRARIVHDTNKSPTHAGVERPVLRGDEISPADEDNSRKLWQHISREREIRAAAQSLFRPC